MVKNTALTETKALQERLAEVLGASFKAANSPISITLAHMLRRLGPALELTDTLQASFQSCVDLLNDGIGYDDYESLRLLTLVLSCIPGLETEAQVAFTAQFYILDDTLAESREDYGEGPSNNEQNEDTESVAMDPRVKSLKGIHSFTCSSCQKYFIDWENGSSYICIQCIDCNICEDCFARREAQERGELEADWRVVCPQGHRHVKGPIAGWGGVRGGKLIIGDTEIAFKEWLDNLQVKWNSYWENFWLETGTE